MPEQVSVNFGEPRELQVMKYHPISPSLSSSWQHGGKPRARGFPDTTLKPHILGLLQSPFHPLLLQKH